MSSVGLSDDASLDRRTPSEGESGEGEMHGQDASTGRKRKNKGKRNRNRNRNRNAMVEAIEFEAVLPVAEKIKRNSCNDLLAQSGLVWNHQLKEAEGLF